MDTEIDDEIIDVYDAESFIDEDELVDNDDLEAFTAAFNKGFRLA